MALGSGPWLENPPPVDVYIDINHRPGVGSSRLLEGRPGFLRAADAWEFALSISSAGALFYRAQPQAAALVRTLPASFDKPARAWETSVPVSLLRGKPGSWGYGALCASAGGDGAVLAALGSVSEQRQLWAPGSASNARICAQRLSPAQAAMTVREDP